MKRKHELHFVPFRDTHLEISDKYYVNKDSDILTKNLVFVAVPYYSSISISIYMYISLYIDLYM